MIKDNIRQAVEQVVVELTPPELKSAKPTAPEFIVEHPKDESHGDYAVNVAMQLASVWRRPPLEIAQAIVDRLPALPDVAKVEVAPPGFINFTLSDEWLQSHLIKVLEKQELYGLSDWGQGQTWLIEHTSPNPNKAMHLGHLRNNVTGMAISNLWEAIGVKVIRDAVDNNRGIAISKLMWGYLKFARENEAAPVDLQYWHDNQEEWLTPDKANQRPDRFMDSLYTLAAEDFKNPAVEQQVRQWVVDWEAKDPLIWALWTKVLEYVYEGQKLTLERLGNKWDRVWHEHEHYEKGKAFVDLGLEKGVFKRLETGVVLTNLEAYDLPDTVVIKSDGTSLYITQDLALTNLKRETFNADKLFWVIGPEQSLALQQLFAVCEQLGIGTRDEFTHLAYGYMSIKGQGKMSSRLGNVIYIDDLIDASKEEILVKMPSEHFESEAERQQIAEQVAVGAVKYSILKVGRTTDMAFDLEAALSVEGDAGPYLQYTQARTQSVERKAAQRGLTDQPDLDLASDADRKPTSEPAYNELERNLLRFIARYPEIVEISAKQYSPNLLAGYLNDLAQRFNSFYNQHQILGVPEESSRLAITRATGQVLRNGLNLLGIDAPKRM